MPAEYVPWFRMKVDDLSPREYWSTAQEDMQIAEVIQYSVRKGEMRADNEAREAREKKATAEKHAKDEAEHLAALRKQQGR